MSVTALVLPVSGPYTATWNGYSLGTQNDDGFVLIGEYQGEPVERTDAFGMTLVEAIYRGINWRSRFRGMEFNRTGMLAAIQAYGSTGVPTATFTPVLGTNGVGGGSIGNRASNFAQPMVMSAILPVQPQGTPFSGSPNPSYISTLTALGAVPAPQSRLEYMFTSKVREAPMEFILLPYQAVVGSLTANLAFTTT